MKDAEEGEEIKETFSENISSCQENKMSKYWKVSSPKFVTFRIKQEGCLILEKISWLWEAKIFIPEGID